MLLDSGAADAIELAPASKDEGPAALPGRAVPTAPKGRRPATKSKAGRQGTTVTAVALKDAASIDSESAACALRVEERTPARDCSARASGQGVGKGSARREVKKRRGVVEQKRF